ncbi:RAD3-like DEAD/DEAH box helicase [Brevibacterium sanguinis]|uniref:RAD3-like DEAD/DEAH box helicase n=2 Tax=Brevibacterium TaxID=1696 RepID=A0A366ILV5_9MICO|nr:RAD3-like DEAD/DEAH box helicase [Brevibacterium sanguinis]RBP71738.1 RAD3-like DEAD/DEAH box helicase [Brevibacterium celere]
MSSVVRLQEIPAEFADEDAVYEAFGQYCEELGIEPYPAQDEAILSILAGDNTIVATPTGSGKSLVALFALYQSFTRGIRAYYTAPLKALVSEKFFGLIDAFGAENVGMITGDSTVNGDAPIICATAEILANQALREGALLDVGLVVMDEFHYFADPTRGWAWQVPLLELPQSQFVLMSATLGDTTEIRRTMEETTGRDSSVVTSAQRPVPLEYEYSTETLSDTLRALVRGGRAPVYVVSFAQSAAVDLATGLLSVDLAGKEQKAAIAEAIKGFRFAKGFGQTLRRLLLHGVGVHHAGMLPKYRRLVEQLALKGLLLVISGTDTLGVGINVPIRSVLLTGLAKFDGRRMRRLSVREFQQLAGRAGRAGFDTRGYVIAQAPEHVIENLRAEAKAETDGKKRKKVKKKAAPAGFVGWSEETFTRLIESEAESLRSRMRIDHSTILNLVARPGSDVATIRDFIDKTHESRERRLDLKLTALKIGRTLIDAGLIVERRGQLVPTTDLGPQFALNQPLAPFVLAALDLLDPEDETYARDVVSIVEAATPVPFAILKGQLDRIRRDTLAELKAEGVDYQDRMAILDEVEVPRPLADILEPSFDHFVETHPWLRGGLLEPKSVVRDMLEQAMGFSQFVAYYSLARAEGSLLRYLTDVFRALTHNVPADRRTDELDTIIEWLGETIARTDSSLLDEWRTLQGLSPTDFADEELPDLDRRFSENTKVFTAEVRNALFHRVLLAERGDYDELGRLDAESGFDAKAWEDAIEDFYDEYGDLRVDARARGREYIAIEAGSQIWAVRQTLADPEDNRDWAIDAEVDVPASDEAGEIVLRILRVGEIG